MRCFRRPPSVLRDLFPHWVFPGLHVVGVAVRKGSLLVAINVISLHTLEPAGGGLLAPTDGDGGNDIQRLVQQRGVSVASRHAR